MIVVFAQVAKDECIDGRIKIGAYEIANHVVRQVPFAAHHALLDGPRVGADLEHFEIVIRFQHQQIHAAQMELDGVRDVAQVGYQTYFNALRAKTEAHRINRIVRNCKAVDFDIAHRKRSAGLEAIQARRELAPGDRGRREASNEDRHRELARERNQTADVIGMLMCDQDRVQHFRIFVDAGEAGQDVALAETGVNQNARFFGADEGGVSRAAAGENANFNYDAPPLIETDTRAAQ